VYQDVIYPPKQPGSQLAKLLLLFLRNQLNNQLFVKLTKLLYKQENNRQLTALPVTYGQTDYLTGLWSYNRIRRFTTVIPEPIHIQYKPHCHSPFTYSPFSCSSWSVSRRLCHCLGWDYGLHRNQISWHTLCTWRG